MIKVKFIDTAEISIKAGDGGQGSCHFRREKFVPQGGPDGGHGGYGGSILAQADSNLSTLLDFKFQRFFEAENGGKGGTSRKNGRGGKDIMLNVPCGTLFYNADDGTLLAELMANGETAVLAKGGRGGVGNCVFATSRNQAPTRTKDPEIGQKLHIRMELKVIADVGIIGAPNAGKSTLISKISAARPKISDYPFTTLTPNLGVVSFWDNEPFVVADVPGLVVGASHGKGLGYTFLRHIERTRVIIHMIDVSQANSKVILDDYYGILNELKIYNSELLNRPRITVLSKMEPHLLQEFDTQESSPIHEVRQHFEEKGVHFLEISSFSGLGLEDLIKKIVETLKNSTVADLLPIEFEEKNDASI